MKKHAILPLAFVIVLLQFSVAIAANPDTGPGCGLGKLAWGDYTHQKSILPQLFMATTNNITWLSVLQWFAITTGTSGCTNDGTVMSQYKAPLFAEINFENLSQDMAQGGGEHLASLATLLGVPVEQHHEFFTMVQEKYQELMLAGATSSTAMLTVLHDAMDHHPILAKVSANR